MYLASIYAHHLDGSRCNVEIYWINYRELPRPIVRQATALLLSNVWRLRAIETTPVLLFATILSRDKLNGLQYA